MTQPSTALEDLLTAATRELDATTPPSASSLVRDHGSWWAEQRKRLRRVRWIATAGVLSYIVLVGLLVREISSQLQLRNEAAQLTDLASGLVLSLGGLAAAPLALVGVALLFAHRTSPASQLLARTILWTMTLVVGVFQWSLLSRDGFVTSEMILPFELTAVLIFNLLGTGALLALGDHGLRVPGRPAASTPAFDGLLTLSLVMGLADALVLLTMGALSVVSSQPNPVALVLAAWLLAAGFGLHRRRTWGLLAMAIGNLAELVFAANDVLISLGPFVVILILTSAVQIVLPVPVYFAMAKSRSPTAPSARWLGRVPAAVLIALALVTVAQWVTGTGIL